MAKKTTKKATAAAAKTAPVATQELSVQANWSQPSSTQDALMSIFWTFIVSTGLSKQNIAMDPLQLLAEIDNPAAHYGVSLATVREAAEVNRLSDQHIVEILCGFLDLLRSGETMELSDYIATYAGLTSAAEQPANENYVASDNPAEFDLPADAVGTEQAVVDEAGIIEYQMPEIDITVPHATTANWRQLLQPGYWPQVAANYPQVTDQSATIEALPAVQFEWSMADGLIMPAEITVSLMVMENNTVYIDIAASVLNNGVRQYLREADPIIELLTSEITLAGVTADPLAANCGDVLIRLTVEEPPVRAARPAARVAQPAQPAARGAQPAARPAQAAQATARPAQAAGPVRQPVAATAAALRNTPTTGLTPKVSSQPAGVRPTPQAAARR